MDELLRDLNSLWVLAAAVSVAIAAAAWALQMACGFCSVEPPSFTHAVVTVVIIVVSNVLLRVLMQVCGVADGVTAHYVAPALAVSTVIAVSVHAGPFTAVTIAGVQLVLCASMYYVAGWCATIVTMSFYV